MRFIQLPHMPEGQLRKATMGAIGYDLRVAQGDHPLIIQPREMELAPTGLMMASHQEEMFLSGNNTKVEYLDPAMLILPRSSLFMKHGLTIPNSPGLIDHDFGGEIKILLYNNTDYDVNIYSGTRVAQAVFIRTLSPSIFFMDPEEDTMERSRGGFGSTGV